MLALAEQTRDVFRAAGYEIGIGEFPDLSPPDWSLNHEHVRVLAHADFDAGWFRDVVVAFLDNGECWLFAGPSFYVPPDKTREDVIPPPAQLCHIHTYPDPVLNAFLLIKAKKLMLSKDYFPGMHSTGEDD